MSNLSGTKSDRSELLNEVFQRTAAYASTADYLDLINFVVSFKSQGPYNAYLLQRQKPTVRFAASERQWKQRYGARLKQDATPLIILVPFGPVEFVYDITDVEGDNLPDDLINPFQVKGYLYPSTWKTSLQNAELNFIAVRLNDFPDNYAGHAIKLEPSQPFKSFLFESSQESLFFGMAKSNSPEELLANYLIEINNGFSLEQKYVTLAHELAHIFCGHLGKASRKPRGRDPWRDRSKLSHAVMELEAESAAYIASKRLGVEAKSEAYLVDYIKPVFESSKKQELSIDSILSAAGRLESWAQRLTR